MAVHADGRGLALVDMIGECLSVSDMGPGLCFNEHPHMVRATPDDARALASWLTEWAERSEETYTADGLERVR
jgi:hypothetical protein